MPRKRKQQNTFNPKYECSWSGITSVVEVLEKNKFCGDNVKNSFKCKSSTDTPRTCIYWARVAEDFQVGSKVNLYGRLEESVFLVKKLIIYPIEREVKSNY